MAKDNVTSNVIPFAPPRTEPIPDASEQRRPVSIADLRAYQRFMALPVERREARAWELLEMAADKILHLQAEIERLQAAHP